MWHPFEDVLGRCRPSVPILEEAAKRPWPSSACEFESLGGEARCVLVGFVAYHLLSSIKLTRRKPAATLTKARKRVNWGKTAIFLTLCHDLLWFFEQTVP